MTQRVSLFCIALLVCTQVAAIDGDDVTAKMRGTIAAGEGHPGKAVFDQHCAKCHENAVPRAPHLSFLQMLPGDMILRALNEGVMRPMASALSDEQKVNVAQYLAGSIESPDGKSLPMCEGTQANFDYSAHPRSTGWGLTHANTRFVDADSAGLSKTDVPKLKLKWAFAFPRATRARSQPALAGGTVFVGSQHGTVYALDADTGCVRWTFRASAEVRTGITVGDWIGDIAPARPVLIYFADLIARVYAVNAQNGQLVWVRKVDEHPTATATAQPVLYDGILYQPASSLEEATAADPAYPCCTFRGSISAYNAQTGERLWKSYTIVEEPKKVGNNAHGTTIFAPSGVAIWNSPTIDAARGLMYVGTGDNYSSPAQETSDAVVAFDLNSGAIRWVRQTTAHDAWNVACFAFIEDQANCPAEGGPDVDFAAPPVHVKVQGREILIAAQKSGDVYGIDPDTTEIVWHRKVGRGGIQGGINFGLAAEGSTVFVPVSDFDDDVLPVADARPGLFALNAFTGEFVWSHRLPDRRISPPCKAISRPPGPAVVASPRPRLCF